MDPKRGVFVAPFDELYDPRTLARLAARAEERGWDGFFLWDHIVYTNADAVADPWVALSAIAMATQTLRIGPLVTPPARRRIQKLARETVTLDHLSGGRLILGAGLGGERHGEFGPFGDSDDPKERARLLDEGLERLARYWDGELVPAPVQQPRIPVWLAGRWPNRRPVARAARWDGVFPIDLPDPAALEELVGWVREARGDLDGFDVVVTDRPGIDVAPWAAAGATWCLTGWDARPKLAEVEAAIDAGP